VTFAYVGADEAAHKLRRPAHYQMPQRFKDFEHLVRVALLFLAGIALFLVVRRAVVPASFGKYGHYRDTAPAEIAAKPVAYAGHAACEVCHSEVADIKKTGSHAHVGCESCHGALAKHADDPSAFKPVRPDTAVLCVRCHEANAGKPKKFPQVDSKEHSGGAACGSCHQPHKPKL
jgi:hypothetical protein